MNNRRIAFLLAFFIAIGVLVAIVSSYALRPAEVKRESRKRMRIASGSMAPTFVGQHFASVCDDCKFTIRGDAQTSSSILVCPNCSFRHESWDSRPVDGEKVSVDLTAYTNEPPQRWDTIAFRQPGEEDTWAVKRIVGLPGERITIKNGDVYADNQILRKPLDLAMKMAILVHDSKFPASSAERRWRPAGEETDWNLEDNVFKIDVGKGPTAEELEEIKRSGINDNELQYHNWRCVESPSPRDEDAPIRDSYGYNHAVSRPLNDARDIYLLADMKMNDDAHLGILVSDLVDFAALTLDTNQTLATVKGVNKLLAERRSQLINGERISLAFGLLDQRVFVAINGSVLIDQPFEPRTRGIKHRLRSPYHLRLSMSRGSITLHRLRVYRDIHYLGANGLARQWRSEKPIAVDTFFVLGDNPPISQDSRDSTYGLIPLNDVLGKTTRLRISGPK
jgi:signal peptidase I